MSSRAGERAEVLINRFKAHGVPHIVFMAASQFRSVPFSDVQFSMLMASRGDTVIGVYDGNCEKQWLIDDMNHAQKKL